MLKRNILHVTQTGPYRNVRWLPQLSHDARPPTGLSRRGAAATTACTPVDLARCGANAAAATASADSLAGLTMGGAPAVATLTVEARLPAALAKRGVPAASLGAAAAATTPVRDSSF